MPFDLFSAPIYAGSADYFRPFSVFNRVMDRNHYGWTKKDQENDGNDEVYRSQYPKYKRYNNYYSHQEKRKHELPPSTVFIKFIIRRFSWQLLNKKIFMLLSPTALR